MKDRKAVYYDLIVPPRSWLVTASLLWDQIWVGPWAAFLDFDWDIKRFPDIMTPDFNFMRELRQSTSLIDEKWPLNAEFSEINSPFGYTAEEYLTRYTEFFKEFLAESPEVFIEKYKHLDEDPEYIETDDLMILISTLRKRFIPDWLIPGFPEFDFFMERREYDRSKEKATHAIVQAIETTIPINTKAIGPEIIIDFREEKLLQRLKFQKAIDDVVEQFGQCSSVSDLNILTKEINAFIRERLNDIDGIYAKYRIDTTKKIMGISLSAPAVMTVLSSALHVPFFAPAGIVSAIAILAVEILNERSKMLSDIRQSSWSYLWEMRKIKG